MSNGIRKKPRLLKLEILELHPKLLDAIQNGSNVTGYYQDLPVEDLLLLDQMSSQYPGLRWVLRKQRQQYLLTVLQTKQLEKTREQVKGEP